MNDQPAPPEALAGAEAMKGKTLSMTLDRAGEVVEVIPPRTFAMPQSAIKDMLKQALGLMPKKEMAIGDTITAPFAMAMPIPMPGGEPPQMKGELKSTLTGVTGEGRDPRPGGHGRGRLEHLGAERPPDRHQDDRQGVRHDRLGRQGRARARQPDDDRDIAGTFRHPQRRRDEPRRHHHGQPRARPLNMSDVRPFAALRPRAGLAPRIAAVPYDVVNTEEARALAGNPLSFLHVSRAEIDLPRRRPIPTRTRSTRRR